MIGVLDLDRVSYLTKVSELVVELEFRPRLNSFSFRLFAGEKKTVH